jgi:D-serine deaminase-like pyridoxal phosphate-dependent protein
MITSIRIEAASWFNVENEQAIASPALLLFRERIEHNFQLMIELAGGPQRLRPHVKTHKLAPLVARQIELGIEKFKCATLAEVEMTAGAGATDVMLAFPLVGPTAARLVAIAQRFPRTQFSGIIDDSDALHHFGIAAATDGLTLGAWLDIDCGMGRTGIRPGPVAIDLYRQMCSTSGLEPRGLHAYDGHIHDVAIAHRQQQCEEAFVPVLALRDDLLACGLPVPALVAGGSPTFPFHAAHSDRECSPGTTVLWDFGYADKFADLPFLPAAILLTRVVSRPSATRLCLDLGHKAVAAENPHPRVRLFEIPDAEFVMHSEEHLVIETDRAADFRVGDVLHGIPRHVCPTVALHDEAIVIEQNRAVGVWPIDARGRRAFGQTSRSEAINLD